MIADLSLFEANPALFSSLLSVMKVTCSKELVSFMMALKALVPAPFGSEFFKLDLKPVFLKAAEDYVRDPRFGYAALARSGFGLGQLSTKLESAGKVRVFAMVDS